VVPNKPTTIAKPNFQGVTHNIIQKGASTQWYTRKSKIIAKARKPNHVFQSRVGLSTHINTLITQVWAYFLSRKRPLCRATRVVAYERVDCIRARKKTERKTVVVCSCEVWGKKCQPTLFQHLTLFNEELRVLEMPVGMISVHSAGDIDHKAQIFWISIHFICMAVPL